MFYKSAISPPRAQVHGTTIGFHDAFDNEQPEPASLNSKLVGYRAREQRWKSLDWSSSAMPIPLWHMVTAIGSPVLLPTCFAHRLLFSA
jgi:hypothetical protein